MDQIANPSQSDWTANADTGETFFGVLEMEKTEAAIKQRRAPSRKTISLLLTGAVVLSSSPAFCKPAPTQHLTIPEATPRAAAGTPLPDELAGAFTKRVWGISWKKAQPRLISTRGETVNPEGTNVKAGVIYHLLPAGADRASVSEKINSEKSETIGIAFGCGLIKNKNALEAARRILDDASDNYTIQRLKSLEIRDPRLENLIDASGFNVSVADLLAVTSTIENGGLYFEYARQAWENRDNPALVRQFARQAASNAVGPDGDVGVFHAIKRWCQTHARGIAEKIKFSPKNLRQQIYQVVLQIAQQDSFSEEAVAKIFDTLDPRYGLSGEMPEEMTDYLGERAEAISKYPNITEKENLSITLMSVNLGAGDTNRVARALNHARIKHPDLSLTRFLLLKKQAVEQKEKMSRRDKLWPRAYRELKRVATLVIVHAQNTLAINNQIALAENQADQKPDPKKTGKSPRIVEFSQPSQQPATETFGEKPFQFSITLSKKPDSKIVPETREKIGLVAAHKLGDNNQPLRREQPWEAEFDAEAHRLKTRCSRSDSTRVVKIIQNASNRKLLPSQYLGAHICRMKDAEDPVSQKRKEYLNKLIALARNEEDFQFTFSKAA